MSKGFLRQTMKVPLCLREKTYRQWVVRSWCHWAHPLQPPTFAGVDQDWLRCFAQAYPKEHNQQSTFNLSLVWGRTWNLSNRWAIKSHLGIGLHNAFVSDLQSWQNGHSDDYHVGNNDGIFCPMDIGLVYRFWQDAKLRSLLYQLNAILVCWKTTRCLL